MIHLIYILSTNTLFLFGKREYNNFVNGYNICTTELILNGNNRIDNF